MKVKINLKQRCPPVFLRSPQLWQMNPAIRHISIYLQLNASEL